MRIAMVGLGTAGACMLDGLEQALGNQSDISLTLYDASAEPWRGRVFQADSPCVLANISAAGMSIRYGDPSHAEQWLTRKGYMAGVRAQDAFLSREIYGNYIAEHAGDLVRDLKRRGWRVEIVQQRVTSVAPIGSSGYILETDARRDEFDYVILCAGGSVLGCPFDLDGFDGYIADPYPAREQLSGIPGDAAVGVLGSGLTAVDVTVALRERGHIGPIRMYSRSGTLPLVRRSGPSWTGKYLTTENVLTLARSGTYLRLDDAEQLFDQEVRAWGGEPRGLFPHLRLSRTRDDLRWQLERPYDSTDLETYIFQKSILVWQDIWYSLSPNDKNRTLASPSTMRSIMSRCCPMPPQNGERILEMLEAGQLEVKGGLKHVQYRREAFGVQLATGREQVDYVVNAVTPPSYGVHPNVEQLVNSAVTHGLARRHHAGGLEVAASSSAVIGGRGSGNLFALGDLTHGAYFFTSGTPALVYRSADIAKAIHDDIKERTTRHRTPVPATV
ncbi:putative NAD(P)/FAD-binding protein YdhS [Arthrobacter sp. 1088]|uniref:FAD/NAD(P)-binding protein n=1 Tax=Arthrobacter sp. 1088 TaxID=2817768 RepID=UPI0028565DF5|nr:FAD/NAD(P)-binding protein [Arthrobacter sp. 1088]MDR6688309.1 putative NAD(P)/FAD-binding protein YdhS [Arthrobacter sp. 1088]